jgi:tRNA (guanine-N(7)-)-methyltransferase
LDAKIAAHSHLLLVPEKDARPVIAAAAPQSISPQEDRNAVLPHEAEAAKESHPGRWYERETPRYVIPEDFAHASVFVEFGCGKGDFINALAGSPEAEQTGALMIGVEGGGSIILPALRKTAEAGLPNVRYINHYVNDASKAFAPASLGGIFLNFSDPWPKDRHADRRLTAPAKAAAYLSVLKPSGFAVLKTDGKALYEYSLETFRAAGFAIVYQTDNLETRQGACPPVPETDNRDPENSTIVTAPGARSHANHVLSFSEEKIPVGIHKMALAGAATQTEYERRFRSLGYPISCFIAIRTT